MNRCQHIFDYGVQAVQCGRPATRDNETKCGFHSDEYKARNEAKRKASLERKNAKELQDFVRDGLVTWAIGIAKDENNDFAEAWKQMEAMVDG